MNSIIHHLALVNHKNLVNITDVSLSYTITRSKRKTLAIQIKPSGEIVVRAPHRLPSYRIVEFVKEKSQWIHKTRAKIAHKQQAELSQEELFEEGKILLFGDETVINQLSGKTLKQLEEHYLIRFLEDRIPYWQGRMKLTDVAYTLKFRYYKSRWANCRYKETRKLLQKRQLPRQVVLSFNTKLVRYHPEVIDYIIVHELAHIYEPNHSSQFWDIVDKYIPDYKKLKKQLK
jgi:predicted metal-dependent hydrolase